jgi:hypothetical protein
MLPDGREALVVARVETGGVGPFAAFLEVAIAPTPLTNDDSIAWSEPASYLRIEERELEAGGRN